MTLMPAEIASDRKRLLGENSGTSGDQRQDDQHRQQRAQDGDGRLRGTAFSS